MQAPREKPKTIRIQNLSYAHKQSATLMAAVELDLFTKISQGASVLSEIADAVGLSLLNAERLVVVCAALGLLEKQGENYRNAPDVERFLVKGKRSYLGPWVLLSKRDFERWKDLADFLKADTPAQPMGFYRSFTEAEVRKYHEATYSVGLGAGYLFARDVDLSRRNLMVDLGGGSGCYCIAAANKYPNLRAIVLDFELVCKVTEEYIAQWELQDRISTRPADFTCDPLPAGADVMLMASNLPGYGPRTVERIFESVFRALLPGGEFHVIAEILDDDKCGPMGPALWGLQEAITGTMGRSHSETETKGYLEKAGFEEIQVLPFVPGSLTRVCGKKPENRHS